MKRRPGIVFTVRLIFVLSLSVLVYSVVQVVKAPIEARQALKDWDKKREEAAARPPKAEEDPLPADMMAEHPGETASPSYVEGEVIGEIFFPSLNKRVAILEGTESPQLKKGAGHSTGSAAIGSSGHSVLAGHRDTVFRRLGELRAKDRIELETADGRFVYEVTGSIIVDAKERGAIQASDQAILTLITCYPFSYVGSAPDRYLVSATLISRDSR
ncbi:class D sortase [Paenibacillus albidus]|uniref:class D sortase n=1 Tax=Paenibacillus albidus TaxID=2041023 RepID=UPI001BECEFE3|nr:class D sortase [Paenibacillus albidus]MBT2291321.1 class D sortase [Paenibacillus albidus]